MHFWNSNLEFHNLIHSRVSSLKSNEVNVFKCRGEEKKRKNFFIFRWSHCLFMNLWSREKCLFHIVRTIEYKILKSERSVASHISNVYGMFIRGSILVDFQCNFVWHCIFVRYIHIVWRTLVGLNRWHSIQTNRLYVAWR